MKNIVIALILSLSAVTASADVAATKGYVDRATNATLNASKAYTDSQIGTSRSETDPTVAMTNGTIYIKGQTITPVTEHQDMSGKQDKLPYPTNAIPPAAVSGGVLQQENDPHVSLVGRLITIHGHTIEIPEGGGGSGGGVDTNTVKTIINNEVGGTNTLVHYGTAFTNEVKDIVHSEIPFYESVSNSAISAARATNDYLRITGGVIKSDDEGSYPSKLEVKSFYEGGVSIIAPLFGSEPPKIIMTTNSGGGVSPVISLEDGDNDRAEITIGTMNVRSTIETKVDAAGAVSAAASASELWSESNANLMYRITNTVDKAYVEGLGIEAGINASTATNISGRVTSNVVTKAYLNDIGVDTQHSVFVSGNALSFASGNDILWTSSYSITNFGENAAFASLKSGSINLFEFTSMPSISIELGVSQFNSQSYDSMMRISSSSAGVINSLTVPGYQSVSVKGSGSWNQIPSGDSLITFTKIFSANGAVEIWVSNITNGN